LLMQQTNGEVTIDLISSELDIPKSTAYRYAKTLMDRGFLHKSNASGRYQLGRVFLGFSQLVMASDQALLLAVVPTMTTLAERTSESVSVMRIMSRRAVCLESIPGVHALRVAIERGRAQQLHAGASSRVLLASQDPQTWKAYLDFPLERFTETTITDWDALKVNLDAVREQGYAVSDGEIDIGARAVAVPLRNTFGITIATMSIEAPASRMTPSRTEAYINYLQQATADVAVSLA
ncbi:MAG: IclR family transcriptional regulator, partial [Chloroflexota bacterium]